MSTDREQKIKIIDEAISSIEKTYGKGSIMKLGDGVVNDIEAIPTGALSLDYALGIGGIPRGRVTEVYGPESSGKTTLCLHIIAEAQKTGGLAAFIDAEHALDVNYAKKLGVDTANLLVSQPDFGEQALEITDTLVRSNALDIIVIDSVAALVPRSEIEGEMGDATMAVQARLMSQALRKLTGAISKSKTAVVFINQLRSKIGVMGPAVVLRHEGPLEAGGEARSTAPAQARGLHPFHYRLRIHGGDGVLELLPSAVGAVGGQGSVALTGLSCLIVFASMYSMAR